MASNSLTDTVNLTDKTVEELSKWLEEKGIPQEFCKKFEDNYIDGAEFVALTDGEIKEMVPPIGLAKKIIKLIPKNPVVQSPGSTLPVLSRAPSFTSPPLSPTTRSDPSLCSHSTTPSRSEKILIPDYWRDDTQHCIEQGIMDDDSRSDVVRTLVTLLISKHGTKPGRMRLEELGRQLILKYPFMKDDLGTGYASWVDKMKECLDNRVKQSKRKLKSQVGPSSPSKRQRICVPKDELLQRYPVRVHESEDDPRSVDEHNKALSEEMKKAKPRDNLLLPLMKKTFSSRRMFIQSEASTVAEILEHYPAMVRPAIIEQEIALIVGNSDIRTHFETAWTSVYVPALLLYGERSKKKVIKDIRSQLVECDDTSRQTTALGVLVACMKSTAEKDTDPLHYLYQEYDVTETPQRACQQVPTRNSPRIAAFKGEESQQYFILLEQRVLCQLPSLQLAVFIVFSTYYCFHLEYPKAVKNVMLFFQDYILSYPDGLRRPATYLATASDIKKLSKI